MDVVNITEDNFRIFVIVICLKSTIFQTVCLSIHFWPCIIDDHSRITHYGFIHVGGFANFLNHDFIFHWPIVHQTLHALRRSPNGAPRFLVIIAQSWQSIFSSKSRTCQNLFEGELSRKYQFLWVSATNFVIIILVNHLEIHLILSDNTVLCDSKIQAPPFSFLSNILVNIPAFSIVKPVEIIDLYFEVIWKRILHLAQRHQEIGTKKRLPINVLPSLLA